MNKSSKSIAVYLLVSSWVVLVLVGSFGLVAYANRGIAIDSAPSELPHELAAIARHDDNYSLFMFVHPKCPCTRATISELARLMVGCDHRVDAHLLFFQPRIESNLWSETDLWQSAKAISGVTVGKDFDGEIAQSMGSVLSGHALLYSPQGVLLFQGGITAARGHEGDNRGSSTILAFVNGDTNDRTIDIKMPTFGCNIYLPAEASSQQRESVIDVVN